MDIQDENAQTISNLRSNDQAEGDQKTLEDASPGQATELSALQDRYLRLAAEFENYKRLVQRDQRDQARFANEQLIKDLLPIVDNLQRAVQFVQNQNKSANGDGLIEGVELTLKQFLETLGRFGVKQISSVGQPFDPSRHEAVAQVESTDAPDHTIVQEYQPGYFLHDRILRPAMVTVAAAPKGDSDSRAATEEGEHHG